MTVINSYFNALRQNKKIVLFAVFLSLLLILVTSACSKKEVYNNENYKKLVGEWRLIDISGGEHGGGISNWKKGNLIFTKNGRYNEYTEFNNGENISHTESIKEFTYKSRNEVGVCQIRLGKNNKQPLSTQKVIWIHSIDTISSSDNAFDAFNYLYVRVKN
jgi:hypothetical protein